MKLAFLPPEVLDLVTEHLPGELVVLLWLSGSLVLQRKMMEGGVTSLNFEFGLRKHSASNFPSFCQYLSKLTSFRWKLANHHSNAPVGIHSLAILPRTLRTLRINRALNFRPLLNSIQPMSFMGTLSQLLPNLTTLQVPGFIGDLVNIIPDSVTNLAVQSSDRLRFGPHLTSLSIGPGTILSWARDSEINLPTAVRDMFSNPDTCANLKHFSLKVSLGEISLDTWDFFPRSLTSLHLSASTLLTRERVLHLPLGLCSFSFEHASRHHSAAYGEMTIESLPRCIEHLRLTEKFGDLKFSAIPATAISKLPPGLLSLAANFAIEPPLHFFPQDEDPYDLWLWKSVAFPPLLHTLLTTASIPCSSLPKSLTYLQSQYHSLGSTLALPPLLVRLKLSIESLYHADLSSLANLRQLLHLSLCIGNCNDGPLDPFWPNSLITFEITPMYDDLDHIKLGPNMYGDWEKDWIGAIPPQCRTLKWTCGRVCPIFQIPSSAPDRFKLPSSIVKLSIISQNSHFFNYLPRTLKGLNFISLEPLDPLHFEHLPKTLRTAFIFGSSNELLPEHIRLLPYNFSLLRLRVSSMPDVVKAAATALGVQIIRVPS